MSILFTPAPNDQSILYLSQLFGNMNGILPTSGTTFSGNTANFGNLTILSTMFSTFNTAILVVGALIVFYVTVVGIMKTAGEGQFMGRNWNSLWIPIRMVLGIAALVPTGTGYSAIQMVMMWVIVQGVGAADALWNQVTNYIKNTGSAYVQVLIPNVGSSSSMQTLFQSLTCEAAAAQTFDNPSGISGGGYYCNSHPKSSLCAPTGPKTNIDATDKHTDSISFGPSGACGSLQYCNEGNLCGGQSGENANSMNCLGCVAQKQALATIITTLRGIATQFVQADFQYRDFFYNSFAQGVGGSNDWGWIYSFCSTQGVSQQNCCVPSKSKQNTCQPGAMNFTSPNKGSDQAGPSSATVTDILWAGNLQKSLGSTDFIQTATDYYTTAIRAGVTAFNQNNNDTHNTLVNASQWGWIFAGGLYYTLAANNNASLNASTPQFTANAPDVSDNPLMNFRNLIEASLTLVNIAGKSASGNTQNNQAGSTSSNNCTPPSNSSVSGIPGAILGPTVNTGLQSYCFFDAVTNPSSEKGGNYQLASGLGAGNPLLNLQHVGQALLAAAASLFLALIVTALLLGILGTISFWVMGSGFVNPVGPGAMIAVFILLPMIFAILAMLISVGALLAVYTPLVPYVIFTMGALGWLLSTIEAMVAGPLVALGILSPGGQHDVLGKSEPALGLLFAIFLRPSLMIFGLIAGMLLSSVVVYMINAMFWDNDIGVVHMIMAGNSTAGMIFSAGLSGLFELLIFLGCYVMLIVSVINKSFAAIHIIPDRVLGWMGIQGGQGYGFEEAGLTAMKEGGGAVAGGAQQMGAGAGTAMAEMKGQMKALKGEKQRVADQGALIDAFKKGGGDEGKKQ